MNYIIGIYHPSTNTEQYLLLHTEKTCMRVVPTLVMSVATYMPYLKHVGVDTSYPMHVPLENFPIIAVW